MQGLRHFIRVFAGIVAVPLPLLLIVVSILMAIVIGCAEGEVPVFVRDASGGRSDTVTHDVVTNDVIAVNDVLDVPLSLPDTVSRPDVVAPPDVVTVMPDVVVTSDVVSAPDVVSSPDVVMTMPDVVVAPDVVPMRTGVRYEFRVLASAGWSAVEPFRLRDLWWNMMVCDNTGGVDTEPRPDGWHRCDQPVRLTPFVGSFYSPIHPDWGDRGNLGTVGNAPSRCTPTAGVEWRLVDLATNRVFFEGSAADLSCAMVGTQDRHQLPSS